MSCVDTLTHIATEPAGFERVRYFPRQLLTADDMRIEQEYFRDKQRRHNRFLHGWGVVCGLEVVLDPENGPMAVTICPGYALGPYGDEIYLPDPVPFDLATSTRRPPDPCEPPGLPPSALPEGSRILSLVIRYAERPTRPMRTLPSGCGCDDTACEYSRLRDGFDLRCLPKLSDDASQDEVPSMCDVEHGGGISVPPCPAAPTSPWVELATIRLAAANGGDRRLDDDPIDMRRRRIVYSAAMVQQQVIRCCCDD